MSFTFHKSCKRVAAAITVQRECGGITAAGQISLQPRLFWKLMGRSIDAESL